MIEIKADRIKGDIMIPEVKKAHVYLVTRILIFVMIGLIFLQVLVFTLSTPPETAEGFFELFNQNTFLGLLSLDFLYLINNALLIMIYFGISLYLLKYKPILALIALLVGAIGIAAYYASNPAFEFYFLSKRYEMASGLEKERLLANGELLLAGYIGTAFISYYILNAIALYIYGIAFLLSKDAPKKIGILGLISAVLMSVPSSFGTVGMVFALLSLIPWIVFCLLIAIHFKRCIHEINHKIE